VSHKIVSWKNEGRNDLRNLGHRVDGGINLKLTFKVRCVKVSGLLNIVMTGRFKTTYLL
jgi:hypothetical protein